MIRATGNWRDSSLGPAAAAAPESATEKLNAVYFRAELALPRSPGRWLTARPDP